MININEMLRLISLVLSYIASIGSSKMNDSRNPSVIKYKIIHCYAISS